MIRRMALLSALLLLGWTGLRAQSLAEVAKKERDRRKKIAQTQVRSYDDSDLRRRGGGRWTPEANATAATAAPEEAESETTEAEGERGQDPTRTEAYWRQRLGSIDKRINQIRERLNTPGFSQDPSNLIRRQRLEAQLQGALAEREAVVEEARRKGVPPGWLR